MRLASLLGDVWKSIWIAPVTQKYPFEKHSAPGTLRGVLVYTAGDCTGCQLCVKDCPAQAIELVTVDKKEKRFVMRYHADRCTYCGQCVESCRFKCIELTSNNWELASTDRGDFVFTYGRSEDVPRALAELAAE